MPLITSHLGSQVGAFFLNRSYWAVKLQDGRWLCELDKIPDHRRIKDMTKPGEIEIVDFRGHGAITDRELDWSLDIVGSGDHTLIKELWLFCPRTPFSPGGNTATLRFAPHEKRRAFVLKRGSIGLGYHQLDYLIIGKVIDNLTGACECFIWDERLRMMSSPFRTSVANFAAWRDGVMPIGKLSYDVLGLNIKF